MRAWKEVQAGSPQHWKKPRFPNEGLEGSPRHSQFLETTGPQHWQKPRFPNEGGLEGGADWQPAALEEAQIPE